MAHSTNWQETLGVNLTPRHWRLPLCSELAACAEGYGIKPTARRGLTLSFEANTAGLKDLLGEMAEIADKQGFKFEIAHRGPLLDFKVAPACEKGKTARS